MIEQGRIIEISDNDLARVAFRAGGECRKCGICKSAGEEVTIEAINKIGAKIGDIVKVEIAPRKVLRAAFLLFIVPILALMLGTFMGGVLLAFLFLFASFFMIYIYDRFLLPKEATGKIIEILTT